MKNTEDIEYASIILGAIHDCQNIETPLMFNFQI